MNLTDLVPFIQQFIQQIGFPITVAVWLLWRTDKRLEKMTDVLNDISANIKLIHQAVSASNES